MTSLRLLAPLLLGVFGQTPVPKKIDGYYDVMQAFPWSVDKSGPLIGLCPLAVVKGQTLQEINRKTVKIGGLTAIVPTRMTTLNSRFTEAPNLYDGLPREAKVLYLLTLLDDQQWRKVTGEGLTISDCHGPQVAVMQSILPNPFRWFPATVAGPNSVQLTGILDKPNELTNQERGAVKLRVIRHLELTLPLEDNGGFTGASVRDNVPVGTKIPYLKEYDGDEYGQHIKIETENVPRKSQLDLRDSRFDAKVALKTGESVTDLMGKIAATTGVQVVPDPHYGRMIMFEAGESATARDLLQALALGTTGTYRRVGNGYVLTCDLEGVAAHQARIAIWESDIDKIVDERQTLWRSVIAKGSGIKKIKFNPGAYDSLTQSELDNLAASDKDDDEHYIDTATASEAVKREVREFKGGLKLDQSKVGVHASNRYELLMPDGSKIWTVGWLGNGSSFTPNPYVWQPPKPAPVAMPFAVGGFLKGVLLRAVSAQDARACIARVEKLGLSELWLETSQPDALRAAVEAGKAAGIKVKAVIRPWATDSSRTGNEFNRTVSGVQGKALGEAKENILSWQRYWQDISAFPPPTRDLIAPLDAQLDRRWSQLVQLASTSGLSGCALLDAFPAGYAKESSRSSGSYFYSMALDKYLAYGYSESERSAFFQKEKVDPLDIFDPMVRIKMSLDDVWGGGWYYGEDADKWQKARGTWIHESLKRLAEAVASKGQPVLVTGQPVKANIPPFDQSNLYAWQAGDELPTTPEDYRGDLAASTADTIVIDIQESDDLAQINRIAAKVASKIEKSAKPIILDFSSVPANRLDFALRQWLKK